MSFLHKARTVVWGERPATKQEQRLLLKIDWFVLSYTCLIYWSNYLNRTNFASAYVSGMQEDLGFHGDQYNTALSIFTVGYIVGQIPHALALQVVPPRVWFPTMSLLWGVLSIVTSQATSPQHIFVIRFFVAMFEASTFAGSHYILGSWYKESELGKRSGIFASSAQMGSLFSGVLQAAIFKNMNGYRGMASWRWLFIIDGIIAAPIAIYGFLIFPDTPRKTKAWYLSVEEKQLAVSRLPQHPPTTMSWSLLKRVLGRWHWYAFSLLFAVSAELESVGTNNLMGLWLKYEGRSVSQRNYYPLGLTSVAIVCTIVWAAVTDITKKRWHVNVFMAVCLTITAILLLVWNIPTGAKFFAFYLSGAGYSGQASNFAWANVVCGADEQERTLVLFSMNLWSNVLNAGWTFLYPATDAPRFQKGMWALIAVAIATVVISQLTLYLDEREQRFDPLLTRTSSDADEDDEHDNHKRRHERGGPGGNGSTEALSRLSRAEKSEVDVEAGAVVGTGAGAEKRSASNAWTSEDTVKG